MKLPDRDRLSNLEKSALMVAAIIVTALLVVAGLYCLMIISLVVWGTTNHIPPKYTYTVTIQDLNSCTSDGGVEILVPIPYVNGQQVFTDEELNETGGSWHSEVRMTEYGKMISLTNPGKALDNVVFSYSKVVPNLTPVVSAREVYLSPFSAVTEQNPAIFKTELDGYENTTRHYVDKGWINLSDPDGWALGNTTVKINGGIWKPEMRKSIVVDLQFEARGPVPDGAQPLIYATRSSAEISRTYNWTYSPVALSYGPFQYPRSPPR